ncbi:MAG: hypothetical protein WCI74_18065, partial [Actinomycetes bacterium]
MVESSLSIGGGPPRPLLLWAIVHPTLVGTEVQSLVAGGFDVDVQEPIAEVIGPLAVLEYPNVAQLGGDVRSVATSRSGKLGPRARLSVRTRAISASEGAVLSREYDAIMVGGWMKRAVQVAEVFDGLVFYRDYGGRRERVWIPRHLRDRIVHVPIYRNVPQPTTGWSDRSRQLCATAPTWMTEMPGSGGDTDEADAVCVGAFNLDRQAWLFPWLDQIRCAAGDTPVRVFGLSRAAQSRVEARGMEWIPRLSNEEYARAFLAARMWVYPHSDPWHAHYIPEESIAAGIPCVMTSRNGTASESDLPTGPALARLGMADTRDGLASIVERLCQDGTDRRKVAQRQQVLLRPLAPDVITKQAAALAGLVGARVGSCANESTRTEGVGPASGEPYRQTMVAASLRDITVPASALVNPYLSGTHLLVDFL